MMMTTRVSRNHPVEYLILAEPRADGPVIGTFGGLPIAAMVRDRFGCRYRFAGIAPRRADGRYDVEALQAGEWLVHPGLIYVSEPLRREL